MKENVKTALMVTGFIGVMFGGALGMGAFLDYERNQVSNNPPSYEAIKQDLSHYLYTTDLEVYDMERISKGTVAYLVRAYEKDYKCIYEVKSVGIPVGFDWEYVTNFALN